MSSLSVPYVLGGTLTEQQRHIIQARGLEERVGSEGAVVGVERESRFVEMARAELKQRGLRNVEVVNADADSSTSACNTQMCSNFALPVPKRQVVQGPPADQRRPRGLDTAFPRKFPRVERD